jgi:CHAD domain-containing protein
MKWRISQSAAENAALLLGRQAAKYFRVGRETVKKRTSSKDLHRFRIATKRFRYTLEMFRPIYGRSLGPRLKALRGLQDALGKVSDARTLIEMLPGDPGVRRELAHTLKQSAKQFRKEWKTFDAPGSLREWKAYLGSPRTLAAPSGKAR